MKLIKGRKIYESFVELCEDEFTAKEYKDMKEYYENEAENYET